MAGSTHQQRPSQGHRQPTMDTGEVCPEESNPHQKEQGQPREKQNTLRTSSRGRRVSPAGAACLHALHPEGRGLETVQRSPSRTGLMRPPDRHATATEQTPSRPSPCPQTFAAQVHKRPWPMAAPPSRWKDGQQPARQGSVLGAAGGAGHRHGARAGDHGSGPSVLGMGHSTWDVPGAGLRLGLDVVHLNCLHCCQPMTAEPKESTFPFSQCGHLLPDSHA